MEFEELVELNKRMSYDDLLLLEAISLFNDLNMPESERKGACVWLKNTYMQYLNACICNAPCEMSAFASAVGYIVTDNGYTTAEELEKIDFDDIVWKIG